MKTTARAMLICLGVLLLIMASIFVNKCNAQEYNQGYTREYIESIIDKVLTEKAQPKPICPKTLMGKDCLTCHVAPDWKLKEAKPDRVYQYPSTDLRIADGIAYYEIRGGIGFTESDNFNDVCTYLAWHPEVTKLVMELHTPGGSLFDGFRIVGMMWQLEQKGIPVETRLYGLAASAGALIFMSGTKGHRLVAPTAELMDHELSTFTFWEITTPTGAEEKASVLRHLQDKCNLWAADRSKMTKEEWDKTLKNKELWLSASDLIEVGIADGYIGQEIEKKKELK